MQSEKTVVKIVPWVVALAVAAMAAFVGSSVASGQEDDNGAVMPMYDEGGRLLLPKDYRQWVFAGSSLGMSYSEGGGGMEMFHHTLIEPSAYRAFARTGTFREGTMLVLLLHGQGEGVVPQRRGSFANEIHGLEMAVKDSRRFEGGWAYFGFGGSDGLRDSAAAFAAGSCAGCHAEHAAYDNVFLQFYPLLAEVAPATSEARLAMQRGGGEPSPEEARGPAPASPMEGRLALGGLDPVELTAGSDEMGKAEIIAVRNNLRYQFVSEPNRRAFAENPERFSVQNDTCPVVPGAPARPDLFAVHEGKIYIFASENCIREFQESPETFLR